MKTTVHIIPHSHWDREWYMAFEQHRVKLVELIDQTMKLFEKDPAFCSFHLDGQTIVLDDYLEIKPENKEKVEKYIREGKFSCGPWYILQDEFLTSGESNVRNLLVGMKEAKEYGNITKIGYFPDAFGNAGQMPQLLKQAGMKAVVFGRGVKPVGFNNEVLEGGAYESTYSEMFWESPDGSALPGILFANWYNNGVEIPVDPAEAKEYWDERLESAGRYAGTSHLLLMNGCDHQPVQRDLSAAIETARKLYPDIEFIQSDFDTYVDAIAKEMGEKVSTVKGELTSQETDGLVTLVNTTSSHIPLKQLNRIGEAALEKEAEPMAVLAALQGKEYPKEFLLYSWKTLMQNHPHDSICGCSVDSVNAEIKTRFDKSRQVANTLFADSMIWLADKIDTAGLAKEGDKRKLPFAVFNTTGWDRTGVVSTVLDYERYYSRNLQLNYEKMDALELPELSLKDAAGNAVRAKIEDMGTRFGYDLPDDKFRQPYMARQIKVTFEAKDIPAMGYAVYCVEEGAAEVKKASLRSGEYSMENAFIKVEICEDGTYSLTEKETGRCYPHIGYYEETGDIGNEYIYVQDAGKTPILTKGAKAQIEVAEDEDYRCTFRIRHVIEVPESADDVLEKEHRQCIDIHKRTAKRSARTVKLAITTLLTLEKSARGVKVETAIDNTAKDHRIRVIVPTGLQAEKHFAASTFEVVERNNRHSKMWKNPSCCEHQQDFAAMRDEKDGIMVDNIGLYEYEVLPDQDNAIAVTLLRCTGEMGDWGDFPTPAAQLLGLHTLQYEIIPFKAGDLTKAYAMGHQFQTMPALCQTGIHTGTLPVSGSFLKWSGDGLNLTGFKMAQEGTDIIVRFVNETKEPVTLTLDRQEWFDSVYYSNVIEENRGALAEENGSYRCEVKPFEIFTLGIVSKK